MHLDDRIKKVILIVALAFYGWFGEWSFLVSAARSMADCLMGGAAFPMIADINIFYGISWRVIFYRGGVTPDGLAIGGGVLATGLLFFGVFEYLKGKL